MDEDEAIDAGLEEGGGSSFLPIVACILAVLGIGLGGTGLYLAYQGTQQLRAFESLLESQKGQATESRQTLNAFDDRLANLEASFEEVRKDVGALKTRMRMDRNSHNDAIQQISQAINTNRQQINQNIEDIAAIPEQVMVKAPEPPKRENNEKDEEENSSPQTTLDSAGVERDASGNLVHTIEAGDYFGELAREYGVSLSAILRANPSANPDRLQIGQKVIIPVKE